MKKLSAIIILGFLAISLFAPVLTFAQPTAQNLNECCKINTKFNAFSVKVGAADTPLQFDHKSLCVVGAQGGSCVLDDTDYSEGLEKNTTFDDKNVKCGDDAKATVPKYIAMDGWGMVCLLNTVYNVCNWLFYLMMVAVVIVFVIAGARYMMAAGDPEKSKGAKGMIIYGIVGLVIALIAKLVPSVVKLIVGM